MDFDVKMVVEWFGVVVLMFNFWLKDDELWLVSEWVFEFYWWCGCVCWWIEEGFLLFEMVIYCESVSGVLLGGCVWEKGCNELFWDFDVEVVFWDVLGLNYKRIYWWLLFVLLLFVFLCVRFGICRLIMCLMNFSVYVVVVILSMVFGLIGVMFFMLMILCIGLNVLRLVGNVFFWVVDWLWVEMILVKVWIGLWECCLKRFVCLFILEFGVEYEYLDNFC